MRPDKQILPRHRSSPAFTCVSSIPSTRTTGVLPHWRHSAVHVAASAAAHRSQNMCAPRGSDMMWRSTSSRASSSPGVCCGRWWWCSTCALTRRPSDGGGVSPRSLLEVLRAPFAPSAALAALRALICTQNGVLLRTCVCGEIGGTDVRAIARAKRVNRFLPRGARCVVAADAHPSPPPAWRLSHPHRRPIARGTHSQRRRKQKVAVQQAVTARHRLVICVIHHMHTPKCLVLCRAVCCFGRSFEGRLR